MKIEIPGDKKLVHETVIPIRWSDLDALGHVNNTNYFEYMEIARLDWLQSIGFSADPEGAGPVIASAFCNFIKQIDFPGDLLVKQYVAHVGPSSFDSIVTLERVDAPGRIQAEGGVTVLWGDAQTRKSELLPDWLRSRLV